MTLILDRKLQKAREGGFMELPEVSRNEDPRTEEGPMDETSFVDADMEARLARLREGVNAQLPEVANTDLGVRLDLPPRVTEAQVNHVPDALHKAVQAWRTARAPTEMGHRFTLEKSGLLWVKCLTKNSPRDGEWVALTYKKGDKLVYYAPSGLQKKYGAEVLQELGITARVPPVAEAEAREILNAAQDAAAATDADLPQAAAHVYEALDDLLIDKDFLALLNDSKRPIVDEFRDLMAANKLIWQGSGELAARQGQPFGGRKNDKTPEGES